MPENENPSLKEQLALEHYKFVLNKINFLDSIIHKNISLLSKILTTLISFIIATVLYFKSGKVDETLFVFSLNSISFLFVFISVIFSLMTISTMLSWIDYRKEEMALLEHLNVDIGRKPPSISNLIRWTETWYLIALLTIGVIGYNTQSIIFSFLNM